MFILKGSQNFIPSHVFECGQVFRYKRLGDEKYEIISDDKICVVEKAGNDIVCLTEYDEYFKNYFDLDTDYSQIIKEIKHLPFMEFSTSFASGIRILKQDIFETIISFIISANNNIPRIKSIIEKMCVSLGEKKDNYFAFPKPEKLALASKEILSSCGAGYRSSYIVDTARQIVDGFDLDIVFKLSQEEANKKLCQLSGVGPKVADCILLFAYQKKDVFPVDTWIKKIYTDIFNDKQDDIKKVKTKLLNIYGQNSGYAQQYLYYAKRSQKI